jgi:enolase-phosphatase E1
MKAIVTDIEGTTTSVSFVYDVLFPYAREHIQNFISTHRQDDQLSTVIAEIKKLAGTELDDKQVVQQLLNWMDNDEKITPLKTIQGMIWTDGYTRGRFKGHIYADVPDCMKRWHELGIPLYIYSSGSVQAQKLLFSYSEFGDLSPYISGHFDTTIGNKKETESYLKISGAISQKPCDVLFLSDVTAELDAAATAGFQTCLVDRDGNKKSEKHLGINSFNDIRDVIQ